MPKYKYKRMPSTDYTASEYPRFLLNPERLCKNCKQEKFNVECWMNKVGEEESSRVYHFVTFFLYYTKNKGIMCVDCIEHLEQNDPDFAIGLEQTNY